MPGPALSAGELAEELRRSERWLYDRWRDLCKKHGMPAPLLAGATPLTWSRAQIYAWLDRDLTPQQRLAAQAYRAAAAAAAGARHIPADTLIEDEHRAALDRRFAKTA